MEIFIPGLTSLLLIALFVFLIMPRLGAPILAILSLVLLIYTINNHMQMFYSEYRYSTWQNALKPYASFIIVGTVIFLILTYLLYLFGIGAGNRLPVSNMPPFMGVMSATRTNGWPSILTPSLSTASTASTASTGPQQGIVGSTIDAVSRTASGIGAGVSNVVGNVATNLGNMLGTPRTYSMNRTSRW